MKRLVLLFCLLLCGPLCRADSACPEGSRADSFPGCREGSLAGCREALREFYTRYMLNFESDPARNDSLCRAYFAPGLPEKMARVARATGADPVLRAQDTNPDALETLAVEELGGEWYLVSYRWRRHDARSRIEIPVKAAKRDGRCTIRYITPVWHGVRYGDDLLRCEATVGALDQTSPEAFLRSFYAAYAAAYCAMPEELEQVLAGLRAGALTDRARKQFERAAAEHVLDGEEGYDLLIDHFDLDPAWRPTIEPVDAERFLVTFPIGERPHRIQVGLAADAKGWRIDRVAIRRE